MKFIIHKNNGKMYCVNAYYDVIDYFLRGHVSKHQALGGKWKKIKFKISVSNHSLMAKIEENWQKN